MNRKNDSSNAHQMKEAAQALFVDEDIYFLLSIFFIVINIR